MSWKSCSSCRNDIDFGATYWQCSVSTCNRKRTAMYFCSVGCWEAHVPMVRHRDAWAVEAKAPSKAEWEAQQIEDAVSEKKKVVAASSDSGRKVVAPARRSAAPATGVDGQELPQDILIVVSKLKKYIKARSGMNTSDNVMPVLSDEIRRICDRAIRIAGENERKTVLDRDLRDALKD